jgi:hypothetical protein
MVVPVVVDHRGDAGDVIVGDRFCVVRYDDVAARVRTYGSGGAASTDPVETIKKESRGYVRAARRARTADDCRRRRHHDDGGDGTLCAVDRAMRSSYRR